MRRAGLSASAELLVIFGPFGLKLPIHAHFGGYDGAPHGTGCRRNGSKKLEMVEKV